MLRVLVYASLWLVVALLGMEDRMTLILMSSLLTICSGAEIFLMFRKQGIVALLSPFLICCTYLFFINFGISNFIFLIPGYQQYFEFYIYDFFGSFEVFYRSFSHSLNYVMTGFISLIVGYELEAKTKMLSRFTQMIFQTRYLLVSSYDMQLWKIVVLWAISSLSKIYAIIIGVYGFTASSIALEQHVGSMQLLSYGFALSKGALFFVSLLYFTNTQNGKVKFWLGAITGTELFFGLLSGFKSQLMFPFLIIMLANIIVTKRIKFKFIIPAILSIFLAYALIEPMRAASYGYQSDKKVGTSELIEMATTGVKEKQITEENALPFLYVFMYRNSLGVFLSIAENLVNHEHRFYPHFDTERKIFYAPILAYVPRAVWPDKPQVSNGGVLYNREIMGAPDDVNVSIATSTFGYFLLGTHYPLLFTIGFFLLLGMMQYYLHSLFRNGGLGGIIICVGLLMTFGVVEEAQMVIIAYFRELPLFILFQFLFLHRFSPSAQKQIALK